MIEHADSEDAEFWQNVIRNTLNLWVEPEINRRLADGEIDKSWRMFGAQVVMNVGRPPEVRLNNEMAAVFAGRLPGATPDDVGRSISLNDLETIEEARLTNDDDNAGHITLLVHRGKWFVSFDFRYNRGLIVDYLKVADEFLATARDALAQGRRRALVENLLAAVEHIARCYLLQAPNEDPMRPNTSHNFVQAQFNREGSYGNVDRSFVMLLNDLWKLRNPARYRTAQLPLDDTTAGTLLATAEDMRRDIEKRLPRRSPASSA